MVKIIENIIKNIAFTLARNMVFLFGLFILMLQICNPDYVYSQGIGINNSGAAPNPSAVLDISSTTSGLLIPRMNTVQMNAITPTDTALMIFNTDNNCIYYYTGPPANSWQAMYCSCASAPAQPGVITGPQVACQGSSLVYSIVAVATASSYSWSVPTGCVVTAGQGTTSVTVTIGSVPGEISVIASNSCGSSIADSLAIIISPAHGSITFNYLDGVQTWNVPVCVSTVTVSVYGAQGGSGGYHNQDIFDAGGYGGSVVGTLTVAPGSILNIFVGQQGILGVMAKYGLGGWNGGGTGYYIHSSFSGGGGGGASDIRVGGVALANRVVVAGGGGGGGCSHTTLNYEQGGPGGAATTALGAGYYNNVQGNAQSGKGGAPAGGAGGVGTCAAGAGTLGIGGNDCNTVKNGGGGGGGGYYGGGAGCEAGGGGGSNYVGGLASVTTNAMGTQIGNGKVVIQW